MPRKSALDPQLRVLLDQASALKRKARTERAPLRVHRRKLAAAVAGASDSLRRTRVRLSQVKAPPEGLPWDAQLFPWKVPQLIAEAEQAVQDTERALAARQTVLALFDEMHRPEDQPND